MVSLVFHQIYKGWCESRIQAFLAGRDAASASHPGDLEGASGPSSGTQPPILPGVQPEPPTAPTRSQPTLGDTSAAPTPAVRSNLTPSAEAGAAGSKSSSKQSKLTMNDYVEAQKYAKYAVSALQYEDASTAIENMHKALAILTKYEWIAVLSRHCKCMGLGAGNFWLMKQKKSIWVVFSMKRVSMLCWKAEYSRSRFSPDLWCRRGDYRKERPKGIDFEMAGWKRSVRKSNEYGDRNHFQRGRNYEREKPKLEGRLRNSAKGKPSCIIYEGLLWFSNSVVDVNVVSVRNVVLFHFKNRDCASRHGALGGRCILMLPIFFYYYLWYVVAALCCSLAFEEGLLTFRWYSR